MQISYQFVWLLRTIKQWDPLEKNKAFNSYDLSFEEGETPLKYSGLVSTWEE